MSIKSVHKVYLCRLRTGAEFKLMLACCVTGGRNSGKKAGDESRGLPAAATAEKTLALSLRQSMRRNELHRTHSPSPLLCCTAPQGSSADLHALARSPARSPSKAARRKRTEPVPDPVGVTPCDNFECVLSEGVFDSETWHTARLGSRIFRFCSQDCWISWLSNPGHLGAWSSPLLSYQMTPDTPVTTPLNTVLPTLSLLSTISPGGSPQSSRDRKYERTYAAHYKSLSQLRAESQSVATTPSTGLSMLRLGTRASWTNGLTASLDDLPPIMI